MITLAHIRFADLTLIKTTVPFHYKERNIFINIQTCVHKFGKARIYLILFITGFERTSHFIRRFLNKPIRLTQCCTQFKSLGVKVLCVLHLHDNVAFTFKWFGNTRNKTCYSHRIWIRYSIELAESVYSNCRCINMCNHLSENLPFYFKR